MSGPNLRTSILSLDVGASYVIRTPEPCATIEEWEGSVAKMAGTAKNKLS